MIDVNLKELKEMKRGGGLSHVDLHRDVFTWGHVWSFLFRVENRRYGSRAANQR